MDAAYITPFIAAIKNVFSTMLQLDVQIGQPSIKNDVATTYDVSGIIGMSGDVVGSIVLSFPQETALNAVARFLGSRPTVDSPDFADAIGELTNMVSGNAKGMFAGDRRVSISCPSVVVGMAHIIAKQKDTPTIVIPCKTDLGALAIEVSIRESAKKPATPAAASATA